MTQARYRYSRQAFATVTLDGPERKNPLTFELYAELRDCFAKLAGDAALKRCVLTGAGGNFCSGGDVHEIIGPLTERTPDRTARVHADDGRSGQGDARRAAADRCRHRRRLRRGRRDPCDGERSALRDRRARSVAFLFVRVGLAGCDMGACAILPRIIGLGPGRGTALYRPGDARRASVRSGAFTTSCANRDAVLATARKRRARRSRTARPLAHAMTKRMLHEEWAMPLDAAIDAEARAQAVCMETERLPPRLRSLRRKAHPVFEGD